jgi:hypothetical protein
LIRFAEDYDSSLLTKGRQNGVCTFISPLEEGIYHLRLVRNDKEEIAVTSFKVVDPKKQPQPVSPIAAKRIIQRFDSPSSVMDMHQAHISNASVPFAHLAGPAVSSSKTK